MVNSTFMPAPRATTAWEAQYLRTHAEDLG